MRELENVIERAVVMTRNSVVQLEDLQEPLGLINQDPTTSLSMENVEKKHIEEVLKQTRWNLGKTADILKIHRNTLRFKINQLGIQEPDNF